MDQYHLSRGGKTLGVYPEDHMREYIAQGRIAPTDLVWKPGMNEWLPAAQVFRLSQAAAAAPTPPNLHWGWVLLLSLLTLGLFYVVWAFVQAVWVKRVDPASNALKLLIAYLVLTTIGEWMADSGGRQSPPMAAGALVSLVGALLSIVWAFFSMRRSLLARYGEGGLEPMGLKLGRVMTLFFNVLYFQYHLTRIARRADGGVQPT